MSKDRMNPELKRQWVAALRSGEYSQVRYQYTDGTRYCCLGVFVSVVSGKVGHDIYTAGLTGPRRAFERLGVNWRALDKLVLLNDDEGKSFYEIADYIEEFL